MGLNEKKAGLEFTALPNKKTVVIISHIAEATDRKAVVLVVVVPVHVGVVVVQFAVVGVVVIVLGSTPEVGVVAEIVVTAVVVARRKSRKTAAAITEMLSLPPFRMTRHFKYSLFLVER